MGWGKSLFKVPLDSNHDMFIDTYYFCYNIVRVLRPLNRFQRLELMYLKSLRYTTFCRSKHYSELGDLTFCSEFLCQTQFLHHAKTPLFNKSCLEFALRLSKNPMVFGRKLDFPPCDRCEGHRLSSKMPNFRPTPPPLVLRTWEEMGSDVQETFE